MQRGRFFNSPTVLLCMREFLRTVHDAPPSAEEILKRFKKGKAAVSSGYIRRINAAFFFAGRDQLDFGCTR